MTRDQMIAHLVLHGYEPYADTYGWVGMWSDEQNAGRTCKFFDADAEGRPGWDVRKLISDFAFSVGGWAPTTWDVIRKEQLVQLLIEPLPPKFRHPPPQPSKSDPLAQRGWEFP